MNEYVGQEFSEQSGTDFKNLGPSEFDNCRFNGLNFTDHSFKSCRFIECIFIKCNFSQTDLVNACFRDVLFQDCRMMGINWCEIKALVDPKFESCNLDYSVFQGLDLKKVSFLNCSAKDVDFSAAQLGEACFSGTVLENATFQQADLKRADLRGATRYFIDPLYTKLKGAKVDFPESSSILIALGLDVSFQ